MPPLSCAGACSGIYLRAKTVRCHSECPAPSLPRRISLRAQEAMNVQCPGRHEGPKPRAPRFPVRRGSSPCRAKNIRPNRRDPGLRRRHRRARKIQSHPAHQLHARRLQDRGFPGAHHRPTTPSTEAEWAYGARPWFELGLYLPLYSISKNHDATINGGSVAADPADSGIFLQVNRMFRTSRDGSDQIIDLDQVEAIELCGTLDEPGRYHVDQMELHPLPSGHTSRRPGSRDQSSGWSGGG